MKSWKPVMCISDNLRERIAAAREARVIKKKKKKRDRKERRIDGSEGRTWRFHCGANL
jgi:hypothetical protein